MLVRANTLGGGGTLDATSFISVNASALQAFPTNGKAKGFYVICNYNPNTDIYTNVNPSTGETSDGSEIWYARTQNGSLIANWSSVSWLTFAISDNAVTPSRYITSAASQQMLVYYY